MNIILTKIRTTRGGFVFVDKRELDVEHRIQLRLYNKCGARVRGEFTSIHRENLDPDGTKTAILNQGTSILGPNLCGYAKKAYVKREISRLKQDLADYEITQIDGQWFGLPKRRAL
ncbi:hypothetical protein HA052_04535 [Chromobacterium haemolyticum]|uniref:Uncharacterized protein n=1 Tax=Chromobacterium fluminis TaxID=3044269 RepID=A0ABX0L5W4_9NEIS|nr:hypothetical protein [Chromobacterium haemolyticum]NHR04458.1 hypothetical protein [Chromobacterium haemolyticum]